MKRVGFLTIVALLLVISCTSSGETYSSPQNDLIFIPAGWFIMGENDGWRSNQPQHQVYLDAYYIMRTEVNRIQFAVFLETTGYQAPGWVQEDPNLDSNLPVTGVLWEDAVAYCDWIGMRLPSEAEWEKAARGTDARRFPWGNNWDSSLANTQDSNFGGVVPVGSYPKGASPYGLLDMSGNVSEWVADTFTFDYYTYAPRYNPQGPDIVMDHGLRGGSYQSATKYATTYFRDSSHSALPNARVGFRCAISANKNQEN